MTPIDRRVRRRLLLLLFGLSLSTGWVVWQLVTIQILGHERFLAAAQDQQQSHYLLEARRGTLYDRTGTPLALSIEEHAVYALPSKVADRRRVARKLSSLLDLSEGALFNLLRRSGFVYLKRKVPDQVAQAVQEARIPGVEVETRYGRVYPYHTLAGPLLGKVGRDGRGLEGLELAYDPILAGVPGIAVYRRDGQGALYPDLDLAYRAPRQGHEVVLTIDREIQEIAETVLEAAIARTASRSGSMLVVQPQTGEVLAMANWPTADPNLSTPLPRNRAATDVHEPGSTFKVVTLTGVYEEVVATPEERIFCEGGRYRVGGRLIQDVEEHGWLTVQQIIEQSSNVGMVKLAERLGRERLFDVLRRFGFGSRTGIDFPGEAAGVVRPIDKWSALSLASLAMGYEVSVTPLQMVMAYAAIANGGLLLKPRLVQEVRRVGGQVLESRTPQVIRRVMNQSTAVLVRRALIGVVQAGTGAQAGLKSELVAGKTGTAVKVRSDGRGYDAGRLVVSFVGFLPAGDPRWVIFILLDEPQGRAFAATTAAPVFREAILEAMVAQGNLLGRYGLADLAEPLDERQLTVVRSAP